MLTLPPSTRVFVATGATDMRRNFDGLLAIVRDFLGEDPFAGHLFVFKNRRGDRLKILAWQGDGFSLYLRRLERGTFQFPHASVAGVEITATELALILGGIDLRSAKKRPRYSRPAARAGPTNQLQ